MKGNRRVMYWQIGCGVLVVAALVYCLFGVLYYDSSYSWGDKNERLREWQLISGGVLLLAGAAGGYMIGRGRGRR